MTKLSTILVALLLAGCSAAPGQLAPTPTPHPTWTQADADLCATDELQFLAWDDQVGATAYSLYYQTLGDLPTARKQAEAASAKFLKIANKMDTPPAARLALGKVQTALAAGVARFKTKLTQPQYDDAYKAIADAFEDFSSTCGDIESWVEQNVPQ